MGFDIAIFRPHHKLRPKNESPMVSIRADGKLYMNRSASDLIDQKYTHALLYYRSAGTLRFRWRSTCAQMTATVTAIRLPEYRTGAISA